MKLIKEYDIPEDGDCYKCDWTLEMERGGYYCIPFNDQCNLRQCKSCKDWLKQQKESKE